MLPCTVKRSMVNRATCDRKRSTQIAEYGTRLTASMNCAVKHGERQNQIGAVRNPRGFPDYCESSVEESGFKSSDFGCASFCLPDLWGASNLCRVLFSSAITRPFLASQIPSKMKGIAVAAT